MKSLADCEPDMPVWSVLLEDGPILAINKPAGLLTQAPPDVPSLAAEVKAWLKERHDKPGNVYLGIPHRLDRGVSGVIVFTRNSKAAARMAEQFEQRDVRKIYWAVVEGIPDPPAGDLTDWILKLPEQSRAEVVSAVTPGARGCRLSYRVLVTHDNSSLVEIEPHTGRMHQIRVQFASRGWPVLGDTQYGSTRLPFAEVQRIALHAHSLTFQHPVRYDPLTVTAPLPHDWPKP
ncbi:MAG: RNA pseudouridine synthase [Planctomycetes bacterium]|nr:RNA pseudouridine synthase [Planctomycetota bacterium]